MKKLSNRTWITGFLGFLGFLGFQNSAMFLFFAFWGGFQYYWWYKIGLKEDERLISNRAEAGSKAFRVSFAIGFVLSVLTTFLPFDFLVLYNIQLCIFACTFALGTNLWAYLTYKYETSDF